MARQFSTLLRRTSDIGKNIAETISEAEQQIDGWPLPASVVDRTEAIRRRADNVLELRND